MKPGLQEAIENDFQIVSKITNQTMKHNTTTEVAHTPDSMSESVLELFLAEMNKNVFVKSTNSVTGKVDELTPIIKDMEAIIAISGEWDREDLKGILKKLQALSRAEIGQELKEILNRCKTEKGLGLSIARFVAALTPKEDKI